MDYQNKKHLIGVSKQNNKTKDEQLYKPANIKKKKPPNPSKVFVGYRKKRKAK